MCSQGVEFTRSYKALRTRRVQRKRVHSRTHDVHALLAIRLTEGSPLRGPMEKRDDANDGDSVGASTSLPFRSTRFPYAKIGLVFAFACSDQSLDNCVAFQVRDYRAINISMCIKVICFDL